MARFRQACPAMLLPLMLAGCVEWSHPTKPSSEFAFDDAECEQKAIVAVQASAHQQPAPKWLNRALGTPSYMVDANETVRQQWQSACIRRLGWSLRLTGERRDVAYRNPYEYPRKYTDRQ